jgi:hypothetical protein
VAVIYHDKRLGMRVRKCIERSEQERFRIFSAIQISDVFKILPQEDSLAVDYYCDVDADVKIQNSETHNRICLHSNGLTVPGNTTVLDYWSHPFENRASSTYSSSRLPGTRDIWKSCLNFPEDVVVGQTIKIVR